MYKNDTKNKKTNIQLKIWIGEKQFNFFGNDSKKHTHNLNKTR